VKKLTLIGLLITALLLMISAAALAEEPAPQSSVTGIFGVDGYGDLDLHLGEKTNLEAHYQYDALTTGLKYRFSDKIAVKGGVRYDTEAEDYNGYAGLDFSIPFGTNLRLSGYYDTGYRGEDWARYEAAVRIQMYPRIFLFAGVRGENGDDIIIYDYNDDNQPQLFLRGDLGWQWNKWELHLQPMLYIEGEFFHDYQLKYHVSDQTSLVLDINSQYDKDPKYRVGFQHKF
jgi:hypothetical protein